MNPYLHGQIFHDKEGKGIKWGKEIAFSVHNSYMQKTHTGLHPHTMYKNKLKIDERFKCET